jgi:hypothetical protein
VLPMKFRRTVRIVFSYCCPFLLPFPLRSLSALLLSGAELRAETAITAVAVSADLGCSLSSSKFGVRVVSLESVELQGLKRIGAILYIPDLLVCFLFFAFLDQ